MDLDRLTELRSLGAEGGRGVYGRLGASSNNVGVNDTRRGEFIEPREASDDRRLLGDCTANAPRASSEPADLLRRIGLLGDPSSFSVEKDAKEEKESPEPFGVGVPAPNTSRAVSGK